MVTDITFSLQKPSIYATFTETKMSSFWWNLYHWLHHKLLNWQLLRQPAMKMSSKWQHFRFRLSSIYFRCWYKMQVDKAASHCNTTIWIYQMSFRDFTRKIVYQDDSSPSGYQVTIPFQNSLMASIHDFSGMLNHYAKKCYTWYATYFNHLKISSRPGEVYKITSKIYGAKTFIHKCKDGKDFLGSRSLIKAWWKIYICSNDCTET